MKTTLFLLLIIGLVSCNSAESIKKALKENPDILTEAIEANPDKFIEALNKAVRLAQDSQRKSREDEEKEQLEKSFENPLEANIREDELIRGTKGAPLVLVEYSDFECPFCSRGFNTVTELLEKYKGKIQFIYKHLPLEFHPKAMPASKYYEAIRIQDEQKAIKFHDEIYKNQRKLQNGESFLKSIAKDLGVNMTKLAKDIDSEAVDKRIKEDIAEAQKFGFQGTPGFLLNGVPVKGAYPTSHFEGIVEELKKRNKVNL